MKELEFKAQLAHDGSVTQRIADFHNVKELYQKLADAFGISKNEVRSRNRWTKISPDWQSQRSAKSVRSACMK